MAPESNSNATKLYSITSPKKQNAAINSNCMSTKKSTKTPDEVFSDADKYIEHMNANLGPIRSNVYQQPNMVVIPSVKPYRNWANYHEFPQYNEVNTLPSLTQPEQSLSVKEILAHHTRGVPLEVGKVPIYYGDDTEFPDPRKLDLSELQELREQYQAEIAQIKSKYQKDLDEKKAAQAAAEKERQEVYDYWKSQKEKQAEKPQA